MQKRQRRKLVQLTKFGRYRSFWRKLVRVLACIVVFCTTYALILPAITMDQSWYCGFEAHAHSESCWVETSLVEFSCQPEAGVLHTHTEVCRDAGGKRITDHCDGCIRLMHGCGYPGFVAIRTLVNFGVNPLEAFFLFC